ncbi:hypothetical protein Dsin_013687 [Dipteronia sinensis]|uniref:RNase H type-1 domain-containing protein n=1 Tax=Dipteronia sinensis TaxID=43782 RepID=A0AAE0ALJ9_9ROSI|nr:hypothetical protein Dsin_013687 [Dipteronia sinensis]
MFQLKIIQVVVDVEVNRVVWNLEEEITRIIKTGTALGVDFAGKEKELRGKLLRRKEEGDDRIRAKNKGTTLLKEVFPRIFALASNKDGVIREFGDWIGSTWVWKVPLRRNLFGWEQDQCTCFSALIQSIKLHPRTADTLAWSFSPKGSFMSALFPKPWNKGKNVFQRWNPPSMEALKFNVDGSTRGKPEFAGIGGVLRDNRGQALCLFSIFVRIHESNTVTLIAIEKACWLCVSNTILKGRDIDTVSDSKATVSWFNSEGFGPSITLI